MQTNGLCFYVVPQVICERAPKSDIPDIDKKKSVRCCTLFVICVDSAVCTLHCRYLVPSDLTVGQFVYVVRKRISLPPEKAIFVFVKNSLPPTAALMSSIYEKNKDADGFLYVTYSGENTFGV